ncbi:hypothetical protein [Pantoea ananatis]|uniref:hypothetical protein n=1 Tax=Pantoea ananas TaxID=553 RepID=UPI003F9BF8FA
MDNYLKKIIFRASHVALTKDSILGITIMLVLSKDFLPTNKHAAEFIKQIFGINFLDYAVRSRTLMVAKLARKINDMDESELRSVISLLVIMAREHLTSEEEVEDLKKVKNKKKNAIKNLSKWIGSKKESD